MKLANEVIEYIKLNIENSDVQLTNFPGKGAHNHLGLLIVSNVFEGKNTLARHQLIMDLLSDYLKDKLHAVILKTLTKKEYEELYE